MKFRINLNEWICGDPGYHNNEGNKLGEGYTELLNVQGHRCCLGMICKQLGVKDEDLLAVASPEDLPKRVKYLTSNKGNSKLAYEAMNINDDPATTIEVKKKKLRVLFKKHGHQLVFYRGKNVTCPI